MYVTGRRMGGDPAQLGTIISTNYEQVLRVREQRAQSTRTFIGVLYGITAAAVFAAFVGFEVAEQMISVAPDFTDLENQADFAAKLFRVEEYNAGAVQSMLLSFVIVNAVLSSVAVRLIDKRHMVSGLVHVVLLAWTGAVVAVITQWAVGPLLGLG
jgi:flagellar protein FlaJ